MQISELIRDLRLCNGWSQSELARQIGKSQSEVNLWENGRRVPSIRVLTLALSRIGYSPVVTFERIDAADMAREMLDAMGEQ